MDGTREKTDAQDGARPRRARALARLGRAGTAALLALLASTCAPAPPKTAVELEREAARHRSVATFGEAQARVTQTTQPAPSGYEQNFRPAPWYGYEQGPVGYSDARASVDEKKAAKIRREADAACTGLLPDERLVCPIGGPERRVSFINGGVHIVLPGAPVETLSRQVQCARAQARVYGADPSCPLLVPDSMVRVSSAPGGAAIDIVAVPVAAVQEIRRRAVTR